MTTQAHPHRFAIWMHEPTGGHYVVGDDGRTAIGPFRPSEVLRHWRVASDESEPVLATPNYYEHYQPVDLPFPATEWLVMRPEWLPPSVTVHEFPETDLDLEWVTLPRTRIEEVLALVNAEEAWLEEAHAIFAWLDKRRTYWGHPAGSLLACNHARPGARVAVVEWPPAPPRGEER